MIKIYFFELDPETGIYKAGFTHNGERHISCIWSQYGKRYVTTGSRQTHDLRHHVFTETQDAAYYAFISSGKYSTEYRDAVS